MNKEVNNESAKPIALTAADLQALIATAVTSAVAEAKKPYVSEQELVDIAQAQQARKEQAGQTLATIETKRQTQRICSHKHARSGDSHCVYITSGGYILCQKCQAKVRPEVKPDGYTGMDIYDITLFNQLFQEIGNNELIG